MVQGQGENRVAPQIEPGQKGADATPDAWLNLFQDDFGVEDMADDDAPLPLSDAQWAAEFPPAGDEAPSSNIDLNNLPDDLIAALQFGAEPPETPLLDMPLLDENAAWIEDDAQADDPMQDWASFL